MYTSKQASTVAWLALLVAIIALIIGTIAYNRSGKDLNDLVKETTNKTVEQAEKISSTVSVAAPTVIANVAENTQQAAARMELESKLIALKSKVAIGKIDLKSADEVALMRANYNQAFVNADSEAKARAVVVDTKLAQLESDLRAGTSNVLISLESVLENIRQNINN